MREELAFIRHSAEAFDAGFEGEAKRLAVAIRVLVYDTGASASLLGQLGSKEGFSFVDTAVPLNPRNLLSTDNLLMMRSDATGLHWEAPLGNRPAELLGRTKPFARWWTEPVSKTKDGRLISRRDYILGAANIEGGAHVDPKVDPLFDDFKKRNPFGWLWKQGDQAPEPIIGNPALHAIRQIAWELLETLKPLEGSRSDAP